MVIKKSWVELISSHQSTRLKSRARPSSRSRFRSVSAGSAEHCIRKKIGAHLQGERVHQSGQLADCASNGVMLIIEIAEIVQHGGLDHRFAQKPSQG